MDLDDLDGRFIQILIVVVVVFVGIVKYFYGIFVKPFVPPGSPGHPGSPQAGKPPRQHDIKDFLEELRRDLGHGEAPPPRKADGLMDQERPETGYIAAERRAMEEDKAAARLRPAGSPRQVQPQPQPQPLQEELHTGPVIQVPYQELTAALKDLPRKRARREAQERAEKAAARTPKRPASRVEIPEPPPIAAGDIGSEPQIGDDSGDSLLLGVDLERAVILQQIFGPAACRLRGFGSANPRATHRSK